MSIFSRFFGRKDTPNDAPAAADATDATALVANPDIENPLSLQVVFPGSLPVQAGALTQALQGYHASTRDARVEVAPDMDELFALAGWGEHVVRLVGFNAPLPHDALEVCVAPAHYPAEVKAEVRAHASHVLLYYAGHATDVHAQYVALATVAGALADLGALAVLNEHAHTSLPAGVFTRESLGEESVEVLESLPLNVLYCGFVKYDVEGTQGVWMRTYGGDLFGLPDFASLAEGHHQGEYFSNLFNDVMSYLRNGEAQMDAGHTMQIGENTFMKLRAPTEAEYFLQGPGRVLVADIISESEINRPDAPAA
ncbi:MAG: DUF4261 domain-containing protein [Bordetella sp.]|nr:DUF4261 domain-containing protein [Bordetella sp.]